MKFGAQRGADITGEVHTIHGISFVRIASRMHVTVAQRTVPRLSERNADFSYMSAQCPVRLDCRGSVPCTGITFPLRLRVLTGPDTHQMVTEG